MAEETGECRDESTYHSTRRSRLQRALENIAQAHRKNNEDDSAGYAKGAVPKKINNLTKPMPKARVLPVPAAGAGVASSSYVPTTAVHPMTSPYSTDGLLFCTHTPQKNFQTVPPYRSALPERATQKKIQKRGQDAR